MTDRARSTVEQAARDAYGQLLAQLAYRWRDIAAAEDALGDALLAALDTWPERGVPDDPRAWLMTAASNRLRHHARHRAVTGRPDTVAAIHDLGVDSVRPEDPFVDHRLRLMFVCAHPAIDERVRAPLMLQTALGLSVERIARAFLISAPALSQRLVRAKQKIRDAGIAFDPPPPPVWNERLGSVLEGIYAAFDPLPDDAIRLAQILTALAPDEPEVLGLAALVELCHARRHARMAGGRFVPLGEQDTSLWDRDAIVSAEATLTRAAAYRRPGPYQLEAAIQSAHSHRLFSGITPWRAIVTLYRALDAVAPTIGSQVAHAVAENEIGQTESGLARLAALDRARVNDFQPYWVASSHLLRRVGKITEANAALARALELTADPAVREYLALRYANE